MRTIGAIQATSECDRERATVCIYYNALRHFGVCLSGWSDLGAIVIVIHCICQAAFLGGTMRCCKRDRMTDALGPKQ